MKAEQIPTWARDEAFDAEVVVKKIDSWSEFEAYYDRYFHRRRGRWYFRGQRDANWQIETTFDRLLTNIRLPPNVSPYRYYPSGREANTVGTRIEVLLMRAFQARASKFLPNPPALDDTLEWFALMRHWGLPSRLVDVTTSPHVALYFALKHLLRVDAAEGARTEPVVWAINHIPLRAIGAHRVGEPAHSDLSQPHLFNSKFLADPATALVAPVHPRTHNERLAAQQGTFLCVGDVDTSFQHNVAKSVPVEDVIGQGVFRRLIINPEAGIEILGRLAAMNIHSASLFPDLRGYAEFIEDGVLLFGKDDRQQERHLDFESLERLGWLG